MARGVRARRKATRVGLLFAVLMLLAAGTATVVDRRRLNSPGGVARAVADALARGDCARYVRLVDPVARRSTARLTCVPDETRPFRAGPARVELRTPTLAVVTVTLIDDDGASRDRRVLAVQRDGRWYVALGTDACLLADSADSCRAADLR